MKASKSYLKYIVYVLLAIFAFNIVAILIRNINWSWMRSNSSTDTDTNTSEDIEPFHDDGVIRDEFMKEMQTTAKRMNDLVEILVNAYDDHKKTKDDVADEKPEKESEQEPEAKPKPKSKPAPKVKEEPKIESQTDESKEKDEDEKETIETFQAQASNEDRHFTGYMLL